MRLRLDASIACHAVTFGASNFLRIWYGSTDKQFMDTLIIILAAFGATLLPATLLVIFYLTSDKHTSDWILRSNDSREWIDEKGNK